MESATVRTVLAASRREGLTFEEAWYRALRQLVPPPGCPPDVRAEHNADKPLWREVKEYWRAHYEGRGAKPDGLAEGMADARRRLRDVLAADSRRRIYDTAAELATLQDEARHRGLPDTGSVADLRARITAWELEQEQAYEAARLAGD